jgi:hypothetical protein
MTWEISLIPSSSRWKNRLASCFWTTDINEIADFSGPVIVIFYLILPLCIYT